MAAGVSLQRARQEEHEFTLYLRGDASIGMG
jgi:hypothetical protein